MNTKILCAAPLKNKKGWVGKGGRIYKQVTPSGVWRAVLKQQANPTRPKILEVQNKYPERSRAFVV
jgi:hypothetical protein